MSCNQIMIDFPKGSTSYIFLFIPCELFLVFFLLFQLPIYIISYASNIETLVEYLKFSIILSGIDILW